MTAIKGLAWLIGRLNVWAAMADEPPAAARQVAAAIRRQFQEDNSSYGVRMLSEWALKRVNPLAAEQAGLW